MIRKYKIAAQLETEQDQVQKKHINIKIKPQNIITLYIENQY